MPTFQPPLTHVSVVPIPQSTENSVHYLHLTFSLSFEENEDSSGIWEIWSNIPELQPSTEEWRALTFQDKGTTPGTPCGGGSPRSTSLRLTRGISLIAERDRVFEYTFRRIRESGEIVWLGDGGHNGKLELVAGKGEATEGGKPDDSWQNMPWEGIGLELRSTPSNTVVPHVHRLPSLQATSASLLILRGTPPVGPPPFAFLSTNKLAPRASASLVKLAMANRSLESVNIGAGACLPHEDALWTQAYGEDENIIELVSHVLVNFSSPILNLSVLKTTTATVAMKGDCLCLHIQPNASACEDRSHLFLCGAPETPGLLTVALPADCFSGNPLALQQPDDNDRYLYVDMGRSEVPSPAERLVNLRLSGTTAQILRLDQFIELRGNGDDAPIWLCGLHAIASVVGEEELDPPVPEVDLVRDLGLASDAIASTDDEGQQSKWVYNTPALSESSQVDQDNDEGLEDGREYKAPKDDGWWWIYRIFGPILAKFWSWLLGGSAEGTITLHEDDANDQCPEESVDEDEDISATHTPADLHSPFNASPTLSGTTSGLSRSQSPSSTPTVKPLPNLTELIDQSHQNLADDNDQDSETVTPIHRVQFRSWASFTFSEPMFTFLVPPGSVQDAEKLKFSYHRKGDKQLLSTTPRVIEHANDCVQLILAAAGVSDGKQWEVQVERVA